jgi:hypothetical protein
MGLSAFFFMRATEFTKADARSTDQLWEEVRGRFNHAPPILDVKEGETIVTRRPPDLAPAPVAEMHVVAWDPDDHDLVQLTLPMWLLRLKSGPIDLTSHRLPGRARRLNLTIEELERYGPSLLVDHTGRDGDRVLVWTE